MAFWRNYVHLVWTTKYRRLLINDVIEPQLYAQLVHKSSEIGCYVHAICGTADHVHMVLSIPPKYSVAEVVKMLKGSSAHFINQVLPSIQYHFQWQRGYGCFSVGLSQLPRAIAYVEAQKMHHAEKTTNRWLEQSSDTDEGPSATGNALASSNTLREESTPYDVWGDMPF